LTIDFWLVLLACLRSHSLFWVSYLLYCFPEMDAGPFSRKQWATQSLRITAKELSLVGGRGKNNAITERFSKWVSFPFFLLAWLITWLESWRKKFICGDYLDDRNVTCRHHKLLLVTELFFNTNQKSYWLFVEGTDIVSVVRLRCLWPSGERSEDMKLIVANNLHLDQES